MHVHVIPDLELLHLTILPLSQLLDDKGADRVARVALLRVRLDHDTAVDLWSVVVLVLAHVVGVNGMSHVGAQKEGACDGLRVSRRGW